MQNTNDRMSNALIPPADNSPEVSEAFRILANVDAIEVPKMPEQVFVEHILPMLSAPAGSKVDLTRWLDVAGTPLRAIDVVENNTGELLFRLPPLMRSMPTVFQEEMRYAEIVSETQAREHIHATVAERYLGEHLRNVRTGATLLDVETATTWNNIRARYGLPLLEIKGQDGKPITPSGSNAIAGTGELSVSDEDDSFL